MSCNILKPKIPKIVLVEVIIVVVTCVVVVADAVTSSLTAPCGLRSCHSRHHVSGDGRLGRLVAIVGRAGRLVVMLAAPVASSPLMAAPVTLLPCWPRQSPCCHAGRAGRLVAIDEHAGRLVYPGRLLAILASPGHLF